MSEKPLTRADVVKIVKAEMKHDGGKKEKRPLSEYQKHMSVCLKKDKTFEECIGEWKKKQK